MAEMKTISEKKRALLYALSKKAHYRFSTIVRNILDVYEIYPPKDANWWEEALKIPDATEFQATIERLEIITKGLD